MKAAADESSTYVCGHQVLETAPFDALLAEENTLDHRQIQNPFKNCLQVDSVEALNALKDPAEWKLSSADRTAINI